MSRVPGNEIIKEILNGNEKIIGSIYKKVYRHLENYGKVIKTPEYNIKESVQEAFEVFYRQILDNKLELTCTVETYVISIAKNLLHKNQSELGSYNNEPLTKIELADDDLSAQHYEEQKHKLFTSEFNKLGEECKRILTLTLEGYSVKSIAKLMNFAKEDLCRTKRMRCKKHLTEKIKENPEYEKLRNANPEDFELPVWRDEPPGEEPI